MVDLIFAILYWRVEMNCQKRLKKHDMRSFIDNDDPFNI